MSHKKIHFIFICFICLNKQTNHGGVLINCEFSGLSTPRNLKAINLSYHSQPNHTGQDHACLSHFRRLSWKHCLTLFDGDPSMLVFMEFFAFMLIYIQHLLSKNKQNDYSSGFDVIKRNISSFWFWCLICPILVHCDVYSKVRIRTNTNQ